MERVDGSLSINSASLGRPFVCPCRLAIHPPCLLQRCSRGRDPVRAEAHAGRPPKDHRRAVTQTPLRPLFLPRYLPPFTRSAFMSPDAVVVGSGPNGLAAAIELARAGLKTVVREAQATVGGGLRSDMLTLPGFLHDVCSSVHP